ncbi:MAG: (d)CMP kinase [bacterium]|nr:(d)CMP kinase [bacterium]
MAKLIIVTIDGPAGAGKSTTARRVAERLGYLYIDTGAMYRAVTLAALRSNIELDNQHLDVLVHEADIQLVYTPLGQRTILNGEDVSEAIRHSDVTNKVSAVSALPAVRNILVAKQREMGRGGGVVMDGRDIGSVVFPHAEVKIYLIAALEERIRRRTTEMQRNGHALTEDDVRHQIVERDEMDSQRATSPLVKPPDAIEVDTTSLAIDEQVDRILEYVDKYHRTYDIISTYGNF